MNDYNEIVKVMQKMSDKDLFAYFTGLSDAAWKRTTPSEWQAYIMYLDSVAFKGILDYMTADEILYVW